MTKGGYEEVKDLLNVAGKVLCRRCMVGFYGRFDPFNPALVAVLEYVPPKKKRPWRTVREWEQEQEERRAKPDYPALVRKLSKARFRAHPEVVNPNGHSIGRSGVFGAFHLDHIVPVSVCEAHGVQVEHASSVANLQVVPWFINLSRGNYFSVERMVGWPFPVSTRQRR